MSKKNAIILVFTSVTLAYLAVSFMRFLIHSNESSQIKFDKEVLSGTSIHQEQVDLLGLTNWTVVTNHPGPAGTFDVVARGSDKFGNPVLAHGFSGRSIPSDTKVRFLWMFYSPANGTGPNMVHFVEPVQ